MKRKTSFLIAIGMGIATSIAIVSQNIQAGLFIGAGTSMLLMIITNLEVDRKNRN